MAGRGVSRCHGWNSVSSNNNDIAKNQLAPSAGVFKSDAGDMVKCPLKKQTLLSTPVHKQNPAELTLCRFLPVKYPAAAQASCQQAE